MTLLFLIVVMSSCFCSCERYGTEVEDMMIIQGVAVDKDNEVYEVTIEMLNNKQSASADASNVGDQMTLVYSAKGETVAEALRLIINKTGNVPIYTHNKVIILSEEVSKTDITKVLDFFESFCIINLRGEEYAQTWIYSRYAGCEGSDSLRHGPGQLPGEHAGDL